MSSSEDRSSTSWSNSIAITMDRMETTRMELRASTPTKEKMTSTMRTKRMTMMTRRKRCLMPKTLSSMILLTSKASLLVRSY